LLLAGAKKSSKVLKSPNGIKQGFEESERQQPAAAGGGGKKSSKFFSTSLRAAGNTMVLQGTLRGPSRFPPFRRPNLSYAPLRNSRNAETLPNEALAWPYSPAA